MLGIKKSLRSVCFKIHFRKGSGCCKMGYFPPTVYSSDNLRKKRECVLEKCSEIIIVLIGFIICTNPQSNEYDFHNPVLLKLATPAKFQKVLMLFVIMRVFKLCSIVSKKQRHFITWDNWHPILPHIFFKQLFRVHKKYFLLNRLTV